MHRAGKVAVRQQLKRGRLLAFFNRLPPCLFGIGVGASAHRWGRVLAVLGCDVGQMPTRPAFTVASSMRGQCRTEGLSRVSGRRVASGARIWPRLRITAL